MKGSLQRTTNLKMCKEVTYGYLKVNNCDYYPQNLPFTIAVSSCTTGHCTIVVLQIAETVCSFIKYSNALLF